MDNPCLYMNISSRYIQEIILLCFANRKINSEILEYVIMPLTVFPQHGVIDSKVQHLQNVNLHQSEEIATLRRKNAMLNIRLANLQTNLCGDSVFDKLQKLKSENLTLKLHMKELLAEVQRIKLSAAKNSTYTKLKLRNLEDFCIGQCNTVLNGLKNISNKESAEDLNSKILALEEQCEVYRKKLQEEKLHRKDLHNTLVELRGNIRVHCRIRPMLWFDVNSKSDLNFSKKCDTLDKVRGNFASRSMPNSPRNMSEQPILQAVDEETLTVDTLHSSQKEFKFERVYICDENQEVIFTEVQPLVTSFLDGFNVCIMAYGPTGGGKSYTMLGNEENQGLIPRVASHLFLGAEKGTGTMEFVTFDVSVAEVYNNDIFDLLECNTSRTKHDIVSSQSSDKGVPTLKRIVVNSTEEILGLVERGLNRRAKHCTKVHEHSSRSHLVVTIEAINKNSFASNTKLQLIDLAGSECVAVSGVTGSALRESSYINRSLSALADVLAALSEHRAHVPYRNSTLTHLLQDCIGGNAKMLVLLCISPAKKFASETIQTLGFGSRAKQVQRAHKRRKSHNF